MSTAKITGDAVAEYTKHAAGKRAIVFCCSVKHAHEVADAFTSAGFKAECIHAETTDRVAMMQRFRDGATTVLVNVDLLGEGVDVPAVEAVVLLRPTQSLTLHIQQIGRALRPADGKQFAVVIDHCGNLERLGAVEQDREWNLDGHAAKRGTVVALSRCPTCFYMGPPFDACPECGAVRDAKPRVLKMGRGELEEWVPNTPGEQAVREMELARRDAQQKNILLARFKDKGIPHERALAIAEAVVRKQRKKREAA
jgi:superfamily II DNA or RNA helicase